MIESGTRRAPRAGFLASLAVFVSLASVVCGITLLFLAMRSVMEVGGSCGSDGVHVAVRPCPDGVPLAATGGILGGVVALFVYLGFVSKYGVPSWVWLGWPALFLSLGWNFAEFGLDPPGESGLAWGWLVCAVTFGLMGGGPLVLMAKPIARGILPFPTKAPNPYPTHDRSWKEPVRLVEPTNDPGPPSAERQAAAAGVVGALERLATLRQAGALTEEEFEAAKARVLEADQ